MSGVAYLYRALAVTSAAAMAAAMAVAVVAESASAQDVQPMAVVCDNKGQKWFEWSSVTSPKDISHASRYVNDTGATMSGTLTAGYQKTIGAELSSTVGSTASGDVVIASLDVQTSHTLKAYGSKTTSSSVGVTISIPTGKTSVAFGGTTIVTGTYKYQYCNSSGTMQTLQSGRAQSWTVFTIGGVRCDLSTTDPLSALAKSRYC
ncbi:hypothetical protein GCM10027290_40540 [Micromonospora sonneratiae]